MRVFPAYRQAGHVTFENYKNKHMKFYKLIPVIFSFLLLAAHFSRLGITFLVISALIIPFLLFIKKAWAARTIQLALIAGAVEWIRIMFVYINIRKETEQDWTRLAVILSVVSLFTLLSVLIFQSKSGKKFYKLK